MTQSGRCGQINKTLQVLKSLQGWFSLPGLYCQVTFPALIVMFSCFDGKRDHHYTNSQERNDLNFLFHALIFSFFVVACYSP
jgi:hypothetical protein